MPLGMGDNTSSSLRYRRKRSAREGNVLTAILPPRASVDEVHDRPLWDCHLCWGKGGNGCLLIRVVKPWKYIWADRLQRKRFPVAFPVKIAGSRGRRMSQACGKKGDRSTIGRCSLGTIILSRNLKGEYNHTVIFVEYPFEAAKIDRVSEFERSVYCSLPPLAAEAVTSDLKDERGRAHQRKYSANPNVPHFKSPCPRSSRVTLTKKNVMTTLTRCSLIHFQNPYDR